MAAMSCRRSALAASKFRVKDWVRPRPKFLRISSRLVMMVSPDTPVSYTHLQGRHKKQSGGHGQFGDVWIEFEPCDSETLVFEENVFGGAVPKNYFPAVEKLSLIHI